MFAIGRCYSGRMQRYRRQSASRRINQARNDFQKVINKMKEQYKCLFLDMYCVLHFVRRFRDQIWWPRRFLFLLEKHFRLNIHRDREAKLECYSSEKSPGLGRRSRKLLNFGFWYFFRVLKIFLPVEEIWNRCQLGKFRIWCWSPYFI